MADAAALHHALRTAAELRDKVVVLRLEAGAMVDGQRLGELAAALSLLRQLGVRVLVVLGPFPGPKDSQTQAVQLLGAIADKGQRALLLPSAGILTPSPQPGLPVQVEPVLLGQLASLGYIPLLLLPVLDRQGAAVPVPPDEVAAAVAAFTDAALLVFVRTRPPAGPVALPPIAAGRRTHETTVAALGELTASLLLANLPPPPAAAAAPQKRRGRSRA
jgi:hypothetical protein